MNDQLGVCLENLYSALQQAKIPVLDGHLSDESSLPEVCLRSNPVPTACDRFAEAAVSLGATYVVINSQKLADEELREAIKAAEEEGATDDALSMLKRCKGFIGHVGYIKALFMLPHPSTIVSIELIAPWHDQVHASIDEFVDEKDDAAPSRPSARVISAYASSLASDPQFQAAKNQDARMYVAKKVFADKLEELGWQLREVVSEAKSIYEIDIKPKQSSQPDAT